MARTKTKRNRPATSLKAAERRLVEAAEHKRMWAKIRKMEETYKSWATRIYGKAGYDRGDKLSALRLAERLVITGAFYGKPRRELRADCLDYGSPAYPQDTKRISVESHAVAVRAALPDEPVASLVVLEMARRLVISESFRGWDAKDSLLHDELAKLDPIQLGQAA